MDFRIPLKYADLSSEQWACVRFYLNRHQQACHNIGILSDTTIERIIEEALEEFRNGGYLADLEAMTNPLPRESPPMRYRQYETPKVGAE